MKESIEIAKKLDLKYKDQLVRHNKKGNYYIILGVTAFCCSTIPALEGKLVVEYARNGDKYDRFLDDFFGIDPNTQKPRFELVPEKAEIGKKIEAFKNDTTPMGDIFDKIVVGIAELVGKSEGSGK